MNRQSLTVAVIAVVVVAAAVATILVTTRKNRVELTGEVLKVRSHQIEPERTVALLDIRVTNPSTQQFVVREVQVFIEGADGQSTEAQVFAEPDIQRVVDYYKQLGEKHNRGLLRQDKIESGQTVDRTMGISAPMSDDTLGQRKALRIVVHDVDRKTTEIRENRR